MLELHHSGRPSDHGRTRGAFPLPSFREKQG
jgi:hypothetical protein